MLNVGNPRDKEYLDPPTRRTSLKTALGSMRGSLRYTCFLKELFFSTTRIAEQGKRRQPHKQTSHVGCLGHAKCMYVRRSITAQNSRRQVNYELYSAHKTPTKTGRIREFQMSKRHGERERDYQLLD